MKKKLQLKRESIIQLTQSETGWAKGGWGFTEDQRCIETTLAPHCAQSCINC